MTVCFSYFWQQRSSLKGHFFSPARQWSTKPIRNVLFANFNKRYLTCNLRGNLTVNLTNRSPPISRCTTGWYGNVCHMRNSCLRQPICGQSIAKGFTTAYLHAFVIALDFMFGAFMTLRRGTYYMSEHLVSVILLFHTAFSLLALEALRTLVVAFATVVVLVPEVLSCEKQEYVEEGTLSHELTAKWRHFPSHSRVSPLQVQACSLIVKNKVEVDMQKTKTWGSYVVVLKSTDLVSSAAEFATSRTGEIGSITVVLAFSLPALSWWTDLSTKRSKD